MPAMTTWTVIDEQRVHTIESSDSPMIEPSLLGWHRTPEGLCRDEVCIPVPSDLAAGSIDAGTLGRLLQRPVAVDVDEQVVSFAAPAAERAAALRSGAAPDFELPDLDGVLHRLSDFRGKKVVLYAYASW